MNAAEDRLSELMDAATCALDPPIDAILAEGERLGRTRRRRRHIAVVAGATAVVLLAGTGVAVGMRDTDLGTDYDAAGHATGQSHQAVPTPESRAPTATIAPSASPTATPVPYLMTTAAAGPGEVPINATAAVRILRKVVAPGWKFGTYPASSQGSLLRVNVDDGKGLAQIFVGIATNANSGMDPIDCALQGVNAGSGAASGATDPSCKVATFPNGDKAMEEVLAPSGSRIVIYRIIVNRSDGVAVEITAQNGDPESTVNAVTRALPPLSVSVWTQVALSRMWQLYVPAALAK